LVFASDCAWDCASDYASDCASDCASGEQWEPSSTDGYDECVVRNFGRGHLD